MNKIFFRSGIPLLSALLILIINSDNAFAPPAGNAISVCNPANNKDCIIPNLDGSINSGVGIGTASFTPANNAVAICDPADHSKCLIPNPDGSINITGGGGGAITANSSATSGFTAGQLIMSDGAKVQAQTNNGVRLGTNLWMWEDNSAVPTIIFGHSTSIGADYMTVGIQVQDGSGLLGRSNGLTMGLNGYYGFSTNGILTGAPGIAITRDGTSIMGVRTINSQTSPNAFRVYNTFTDLTNGEWGGFDWQTTPNVLTIGAQKSGTGLARAVNLVGSGLQMNGVIAVSCAAGTVTAATMVVTNGIVTHC